VIVDLPSEVGSVDASIAFAGDVEVIGKELGEASVEVEKGSKGVLRLSHVIVDAVLRGVTHGETNTSRAL
jgi:hypothetical protein